MTVIIGWSHPNCCEVCGGREFVQLAFLNRDQQRYPGACLHRPLRVPCPHCRNGSTLQELVGGNPKGTP